MKITEHVLREDPQRMYVVSYKGSKLYGCVVVPDSKVQGGKVLVRPVHSGVADLVRKSARLSICNLKSLVLETLVVDKNSDLVQGNSKRYKVTKDNVVLRRVKGSKYDVVGGTKIPWCGGLPSDNLLTLRFNDVNKVQGLGWCTEVSLNKSYKHNKKLLEDHFGAKPLELEKPVCKYVVGAEVKISKDSKYFRDNDPTNPKDMVGEILSIKGKINPIRVSWGGVVNTYHKKDLTIEG